MGVPICEFAVSRFRFFSYFLFCKILSFLVIENFTYFIILLQITKKMHSGAHGAAPPGPPATGADRAPTKKNTLSSIQIFVVFFIQIL
jgi:hypothetical protein